MMSEIDQKKAIRSYLLGEISEDERERLEKRLLADDGYFEQLLFVEEDLIDEYIVGKLTTAERASFDAYFLNAPQRQEHLRFAKAFKRYTASSTVKKSSEVAVSPSLSPLQAFSLSLRPARPVFIFAVILAIVIGGFWLIKRWSQLDPVMTRNDPATPTPVPQPSQIANSNGDEIATQVTPTPAANNANVEPTPIPPARNEDPKSSVVSVVLASGLSRGDGGFKRVKVSPGTSVVRLQLELDPASSDYQSYRAVLQSASGQDVLSRGGLRARATADGKKIMLDVPARLLKGDDYYLRLSGQNSEREFEAAGSYSFRVIK